VTLSANEAGSQIFFTLDGTSPVDLGSTSLTAIPFTAPITISENTTLQFAAFDLSGNISEVGILEFVITNTPTPAAPTFGPATVGNGSISLTWTDVPADPSITGYGIQVYDNTLVPFGALQEVAAPANSLTVSGLAANTSYFVTIKAQNVNGYGPESAFFGPLTTQGAVIANAGPDQSVTRGLAPTTVNLTGAGSTTIGATYLWEQIGASPADTVVIANPTQLNTSFSLPLYAFPQTNNPKVFRLTVTTAAGSISDEVQVALITDRVTITTASYKTNDFRVTGTCSLVGATIRVHRGGLNGPILVGGNTLCVAGNTFTLRLRNAATPTPAVLTITIESNAGGTVATPFTVAQN
jgi:hypothetical protein